MSRGRQVALVSITVSIQFENELIVKDSSEFFGSLIHLLKIVL